MSDARVRELVRRARQGDVDAGVQLLSERRRNGTLSRERVWIAAALGDEASRLVEGMPFDEGREQGWIRWPASQDKEVALRMLAAALGVAWSETGPFCFDPGARRVVEGAGALLARWIAAAPEARPDVEDEATHLHGVTTSSLPVARIAAAALVCLRRADPREWAEHTTSGVERAAAATSQAAVRRALRDAVVPWALGL